MTAPSHPPVFDGHNDVLLRLHLNGGVDPVQAFLDGRDGEGHLDWPRASAAGFAGGLFAIFVPSQAQAAAAIAAAPSSMESSVIEVAAFAPSLKRTMWPPVMWLTSAPSAVVAGGRSGTRLCRSAAATRPASRPTADDST